MSAKMKIFKAVSALASVLNSKNSACYDCGEVDGATGILVALIQNGDVTIEQVEQAAKKNLTSYKIGIFPGNWRSQIPQK
jgi:cell division GTPase FtsZ